MLLIYAGILTVPPYGLGLLLVAKIGLAVLLGIGQIFILATLFDATRKFFDSWIGQVLNFVFVPVLTASVISLVLAALNAYMAKISTGTTEIVDCFILVILSGASLMCLAQVPSWASTLGGGVALSTMGGFKDDGRCGCGC